MKLNHSFWRSKRVLVTGHTGFKGSWLTAWLLEMGAEVHGISLPPITQPNAFEAMKLQSECHHHILDIRDRVHLDSLVNEIDPEVVFHMAAQPLVRESYENPLETYEVNVLGTGNLLYSLRNGKSVRSIVIVTTDKCYENKEWCWPYRETDPLGGYDPYSSSKACAEIITSSFRKSFFSERTEVGIATARAGNVIGGGDWSKDRLLPDAVRAHQEGRSLKVRYPTAIRPWQHVLVPLSGYILLAEKLWDAPTQWSEAFNFAPNEEDCISVGTLLNKFGMAWGNSLEWMSLSTNEPHEAHFLKLDSSKAKQKLGWYPVWTLTEALKNTADWYRAYYESSCELRELTKHQIKSFQMDGDK